MENPKMQKNQSELKLTYIQNLYEIFKFECTYSPQ